MKELSQPDDGISFSEKQISQRALAAKKTVFELLKRRWEVSIAVYYYLDDFAWILSLADICPVGFSLSLIPFVIPIDVISTGNAAPE